MRLYLVGALAVFLMVGCGGSSGPKTPEAVTSLAGVAVDDLIINGIVKAYPANDSSRVLATGKTDDKGSYTLDVAYDGVVIVEVECKTDTSWMINPVKPNVKIDCIDGLKLNSAASVSPDKGAVEVNISPLTELVVRQMKENSTVTEQDLTAARNNIQQMFLVDPLEADPTEGNYAKIIGAIHDIDEQDDSKNILEVIDAIAEDYKDGEAGDDNQEMSEKLATAMEDAGVVNPLTYKKGEFTPVEIDPNEDGIEVSKAFFNELRTQAMSIVDYQESGTPGFLDTEAQSLGTALEGVSVNIGTASEVAVDHITRVLNLVKADSDGDNISLNNTKIVTYTKTSNNLVWTYSVVESSIEIASGTITLPSENPDDISLQTYSGTLTAKFDGIVPLEFENNVATGHQRLKADVSMTKQSYGSDVAINNASLTSETASIAMEDLKLKAYYDFVADEVVMNHVIFDTVTLDANATPYNFSGTLSIPEYVQNGSIRDKGFMIESEGGSSEDVSVEVSSETSNAVQRQVIDADSDDDGFYNSGYLPKKIVFDGAITNSSNSGYIKGKVTTDWLNAQSMNLNGSSDEKAIVDVSVTGKIKASQERPEMMINLGFTNPNNRSNFRFVYAYDETIINGTGAFDKEVENGTIILTTLNGLKSTIKVVNGDVVYGSQSSVTKNGIKIGELKEVVSGVPIIKYTDGSFESLP
jgi:hypothetical protein